MPDPVIKQTRVAKTPGSASPTAFIMFDSPAATLLSEATGERRASIP